MSCSDREAPPRKPDVAELGRHAWGLLHAAADTTEDTLAGLSKFVSLAGLIIDIYPCARCSRSAHNVCGRLIGASKHPDSRSLRKLFERADAHGGYRVVAVAWAARMHACVTQHLLASDKTRKTVSRESARIADHVTALGDDDRAVACFVCGS
jgi:hypothetical protein